MHVSEPESEPQGHKHNYLTRSQIPGQCFLRSGAVAGSCRWDSARAIEGEKERARERKGGRETEGAKGRESRVTNQGGPEPDIQRLQRRKNRQTGREMGSAAGPNAIRTVERASERESEREK